MTQQVIHNSLRRLTDSELSFSSQKDYGALQIKINLFSQCPFIEEKFQVGNWGMRELYGLPNIKGAIND